VQNTPFKNLHIATAFQARLTWIYCDEAAPDDKPLSEL